jgi:phospholipase/lecithinase/hemolysin
MPKPITDGLTLLRALRNSGTPAKVTGLAFELVTADPNATAEAVYKRLQESEAKEGTLAKAMQLMTTGEIKHESAYVDPLDALAIKRGEVVTLPERTSIADDHATRREAAELERVKAESQAALQAQAAEIQQLRAKLEETDRLLEEMTKPKE